MKFPHVATAASLLVPLCTVLAEPAPLTAGLVGQALDRLGARYERTTDSYGDPMIVINGGVHPDNNPILVTFYECEGEVCQDLTLYTWFANRGGTDLDDLDAYNEAQRWIRVYQDDDTDPVLELDIDGAGGIEPDSLATLLRTYFDHLELFQATVMEGSDAPSVERPSPDTEGGTFQGRTLEKQDG